MVKGTMVGVENVERLILEKRGIKATNFSGGNPTQLLRINMVYVPR